MVTLITKEALWESSVEDHHLSSLVLLSAPTAPPCPNKDKISQTNEGLDFSTALRQLQVATQLKSQLKWELLCKQHEQNMREDELIAREIDKISVNTAEWKEKLAEKQEDLWARVQEQLDITFREILSEVSPADSVRLLTWLLSIADNPCAVPAHSIGEVLAVPCDHGQKFLLMTPLQGQRVLLPFHQLPLPVQASSPVLCTHHWPQTQEV